MNWVNSHNGDSTTNIIIIIIIIINSSSFNGHFQVNLDLLSPFCILCTTHLKIYHIHLDIMPPSGVI